MKNATQSQSVQYKIVHSSQGRLRVRIPRLTIDSSYSTRLKSLVESLDFVTEARINSAASSIVIKYNGVAATEVLQEQILAVIEQSSGVEDDIPQLLNNSLLDLNDESNLNTIALQKEEQSMLVEPVVSVAISRNDEPSDAIAPFEEDLVAIAEPNDMPLSERTAQECSLLIRGNYSVSVKLDSIKPLVKEPSTI